MKPSAISFLFAIFVFTMSSQAVPITGQLRASSSSNTIARARVTLFTADLRFFREQRSDAQGNFQFSYIAEVSYRLAPNSGNQSFADSSYLRLLASVRGRCAILND